MTNTLKILGESQNDIYICRRKLFFTEEILL